MVNTRRSGSGSASGQGNANADYQNNPIPPPPPVDGPDWGQMMANQSHLIDLLAQSINNNQTQQAAPFQAPTPPQQRANLSEFMRMEMKS